MNEENEKMPVLNVNTAEIRWSGRELGFILAEFFEGMKEGIEEYRDAVDKARKEDAPPADGEKQ